MGVVTSLGVGKADNWAKLSAGNPASGAFRAFRLEGLRTTIAGTVDDVYKDYMSPAELSERIALLAGEEAIAKPASAVQGPLSRPAVSGAAAARDRMALSHRHGGNGRSGADAGYPDLMRVARDAAILADL
jgi:3-oxoacyl-[acyl-carrier-protein] synthase II